MPANRDQCTVLVGHFDVCIGSFTFQFDFRNGVLNGDGISQKDRFEEPDFAAKCKVYRDYQIQVLEEDQSMLTSLQAAMGANEYTPGPMSHLEGPIHNTINYHVERALGDSTD